MTRLKALLPVLSFIAALVLSPLASAQFGPGTSRGPQNITVDAAKYGAIPNDTLGDNDAIQAALTAVGVAGGGKVTVSQPGTYWLDSPSTGVNLTLNSALVIYANTELILSEGVVLKARAESVCYLIRNANPTINGAATTDSNITISGGTWDGNAVYTNVVDGAIASDGVTITSTGFNGYSYTTGDAAYIWWAAPAATHTGASNTATAVTSTSNCTGVVAGQTARFYTRGGGDTTAFGNFAVASPTSNGFTATSLTGNAASLSFDLYPILGSTNISSTNGTNSITLASSVGVSKTSNGYTNARVTITTQNVTPAGGVSAWQGHAIFMAGVDRFSLKSTRIQNCSKYAFLGANLTNGYFDSIYINNRKQGADGLHFNGPGRGLVITRISGVTDDNLIGFTTSEGTYFGGVVSSGTTPWTNGTTTGAASTTLDKTGGASFSSSDIGKYVTVTSGTNAVAGNYLIDAVPSANRLTLHTSPTPGGAGASMNFYVNGWAVTNAGEGNFEDVLIDGVYGDTNSTLGPGYELVRVVGKPTQTAKNFKIRNVSGAVRKGSAIKLADDSNGQLTGLVMRDFLIEGLNCGAEYAGLYITGVGVKDVTLRSAWVKEATLLSLTGVSTPGGSGVITASHQLHPYTGVGQVANAYQAADQVVFTSGNNSGSRFFVDNTVSGQATAPLSDSTINVFSTYPVSGTGQNAEIRRTPAVVWVDSAAVLDSLVIRDCGARDSSNVNYGSVIAIDGQVKSLVHDGLVAVLGNGAEAFKISSSGVVNYGMLSRFGITDNGSGNSYGITVRNASTRSYLTLSDSHFAGTGAVLRGVYVPGLLDLTLDGVRFGGNANVRPIETTSAGRLNLYANNNLFGPTLPTTTITTGSPTGTVNAVSTDFLLGSTSATLNTGTGTTNITVPVSSNPTRVDVTITAASSPNGNPSISLGVTGSGYTDIIGSTSMQGFVTGSFTAGTSSTTTLTKTGAFTGVVPGQTVTITSATGITTGTYVIASVTNADNVVLATSPGSSGSSIAFTVDAMTTGTWSFPVTTSGRSLVGTPIVFKQQTGMTGGSLTVTVKVYGGASGQ